MKKRKVPAKGTSAASRRFLFLGLPLLAVAIGSGFYCGLRKGSRNTSESSFHIESATLVNMADASVQPNQLNEQYTQRLLTVIDSHARAEVRVDLQKLLREGRVSMLFRKEPTGMRGELVLVEAGFLVLPEGKGDPPYPRDIPVLVIDPDFLSGSMPTQKLQRNLMHEYRHIQSYFNAEYPFSQFYPPIYQSEVSSLENILRSEVDAYSAECLFAMEIDFIDQRVVTQNGQPLDPCRAFQLGNRYGVARWYAEMHGTYSTNLRRSKGRLLELAEQYH